MLSPFGSAEGGIRPAPELAAKKRGPWIVRPGRGCTAVDTRKMEAPYDREPFARMIRAHELAHARLTTKRHFLDMCKECGEDCAQSAEDARVNEYLRDRLPDVLLAAPGGPYENDPPDPAKHPEAYVLAEASYHRLPKWIGPWHAKADSFAGSAMQQVANYLRERPTITAGDARDLARYLRTLIGATSGNGDDGSFCPEGSNGTGASNVQEGDAGTRPIVWRTMAIRQAPLTERVKGLRRRSIPSDIGGAPRDIWRLASGDGRIFGRRVQRQGQGGVVIVDVSGSMSWTEGHLAETLAALPAATIACYSSQNGGLCIIAKDGRRASREDVARNVRLGGSNRYDGPALDWGLRNGSPVLWLSDGAASDENNGYDAALRRCMQGYIRRGVRRIERLNQIPAALQGRSLGAR